MLELKQHPDLGGEHWNATILNEAFETLSSPERRAVYDRKLFERYTKTPFQPTVKSLLSLTSVYSARGH